MVVKYGVFFSADLHNLTDLQPASNHSFDYIKCGSCGELADKNLEVCFDEDMDAERKPHVIKQCHVCRSVGSVRVLRGQSEPLTGEEAMSEVQLMAFDCNGFEPIEFLFGRGWKAVNPATGTMYDIDLSNGEFCDYDVKGNCPVAVLEARATIKILTPKVKVKKAGFKSRSA